MPSKKPPRQAPHRHPRYRPCPPHGVEAPRQIRKPPRPGYFSSAPSRAANLGSAKSVKLALGGYSSRLSRRVPSSTLSRPSPHKPVFSSVLRTRNRDLRLHQVFPLPSPRATRKSPNSSPKQKHRKFATSSTSCQHRRSPTAPTSCSNSTSTPSPTSHDASAIHHPT